MTPVIPSPIIRRSVLPGIGLDQAVAGVAGVMAGIDALKGKYQSLDTKILAKGEEAIDPGCLLAFPYEYPHQPSKVTIETDEFTALCPWTDLPDFGEVTITYTPASLCVELKSLKYYLVSYRDVEIVQEHAANRILSDLVALCQPRWMKVVLDYKVRGGLHTTVSVEYPAPVDSNGRPPGV